MNYIELINNFWELDEHWQFTCCETRLYFYLIKTANRLGWVNNWTHSDAKTAANVGVSENSLKTARNRLIQSELIEFKAGGKFRGDKNRYQILIPKQYPKPTPKHNPYQPPKPPPIYKPNQTTIPLIPPQGVETNSEEFSFDKIWSLYDKKIGNKEKLRKRWDKITTTDKIKIFEYVPRYIQSQPDKRYRKNLDTFLTNKSWDDEIIPSETSNYETSAKTNSQSSANNNAKYGSTEEAEQNILNAIALADAEFAAKKIR